MIPPVNPKVLPPLVPKDEYKKPMIAWKGDKVKNIKKAMLLLGRLLLLPHLRHRKWALGI